MDKKDIYEHLAKIYLDASSKKSKKPRYYLKIPHPASWLPFLIILGLGLPLLLSLSARHPPLPSEVALVVSSDAAKINFNFDPAKKESYSINLNKLDLSRFKKLGFSLKKIDRPQDTSLRVEFVSVFREVSEVYVDNIPNKWKDFTIDLSRFKNISNWSAMSGLSFTVEEWNTKKKKGAVYIDNIRFLR